MNAKNFFVLWQRFSALALRRHDNLPLEAVKGLLFCLVLFLNFWTTGLFAQQRTYSVANAHAHNDYNHPVPFYTAYKAGFGSIEADVILYNDRLYVAHDTVGIRPRKTLQSLYLDPVQKAIQKHKGYVYADSAKKLLLLIDLKTPAEPTLKALLHVLQQYKTVTDCPGLQLVITGNRPAVSALTSYPSYLYFDGELNNSYDSEALDRIALFSDDFRTYTKWKGEGRLPDSARVKTEAAVTKAHRLSKPIRFWAAPDVPNAWRQLMKLDVDYINTDKISAISTFLKKPVSLSSR